MSLSTDKQAAEIPVNGSAIRSFHKSVQAIADLLALPEGWDSYSARSIAPRNAIRAIQLLGDFLGPETPAPVAVPTVRGGIQLEWHSRGVNIEVSVDSPEHVDFFAECVESSETSEGSLTGREDELKRWLQRIS